MTGNRRDVQVATTFYQLSTSVPLSHDVRLQT